MTRLTVHKTYKLFINGQFPRTESGRTTIVHDISGGVFAHFCQASRKDLRDAVEAARAAQEKWTARTAYNRGQILYRMAEMMEGKRAEFISALKAVERKAKPQATAEVDASIDRLVCFAGWTDKFAQVLGCQNPVAGPYYNFTTPEPTGVVGIIAPDAPALLGLISLIAPAICVGSTVIALASESNPIPAAILGEVCATSDLSPGVINILTGQRSELIENFAQHRGIDCICAANVSKKHAVTLRCGSAENVKRVSIIRRDDELWQDVEMCASPRTIEPFVEMKTIWHPSAME